MRMFVVHAPRLGAVRWQQPYRRVQGLHAVQEGRRLLPLWHMPPLGPQVSYLKRHGMFTRVLSLRNGVGHHRRVCMLFVYVSTLLTQSLSRRSFRSWPNGETRIEASLRSQDLRFFNRCVAVALLPLNPPHAPLDGFVKPAENEQGRTRAQDGRRRSHHEKASRGQRCVVCP